MNNYPFPYIPQQINYPILFDNINKLKQDVKKLEERIEKLENNNNTYLKNDDNYYMI